MNTGVPLLIDSNIANTIDFHVATTKFLKVLDSYVNEVATTYAHNYSLATVDPITKESQFFANLNNGTLDLTGKESGNNSNVKGTLVSKVNPSLNSDEIWKTDENGTIIGRINNGVVEYLAINTKSSNTRWIPVEQNVIDQVTQYTSNLSKSYSIDQMNDEFVQYWLEQFRTAHDSVKQAYKQLVTDSTQDIFADFSDCQGVLARIDETIDSSVMPLFDPDMDILNVIPRPYNPILDDKIDSNTKLTIFEMSKKNYALFRNNLVKIINVATTSNTTHGENLVTDELDYKRVLGIVHELNGYVALALGKVARMVFALRTTNALNQQQTGNFSYQAEIDNTLIQIDSLKNKVQSLKNPRMKMQVLSATV